VTYSLKIYKSFDAEIKAIWLELEENALGYIFQGYEWNALWFDCIGKDWANATPHIVVVSFEGHPVVIFPFILYQKMGLTCLEFMGGDQSDYLSPLIKRDVTYFFPDIWAIVEDSLPSYDVAIFTKMPKLFGEIANPLLEVLPSRLSHEAFSAMLPNTWGDMETRISGKIRADSRRQMRRLSQHGETCFEVAENQSDYLLMLEAMFKQKTRRYMESGVRNILSCSGVKEFYRQAYKHFRGTYLTHLSALTCNGQIIATHWGIVQADRYYWLMPSYAGGEMATFSPGRILQEKLIKWCIENNMAVFDFTVGDEQYKKAWANKSLKLYEFTKSKSLLGDLLLMGRNILQAVKRSERARSLVMAMMRLYHRVRKSNSIFKKNDN
jgi:CelD/BcsL family acetyltransferase involved in cellulose biosynthesis